MKSAELFSTFAEYEKWLVANKDKAEEYFRQNDVNLKNIQMSGRLYNILRINGKQKMSDIVFLSADEISNIDMMNKTSVNEILMFKKNYLRKHKNELIDFVVENTKPKENLIENKFVETEKIIITTEELNCTNDKSSQNLQYDIKALLLDTKTKEKIIEFYKIQNVEIVSLKLSVRSCNALRRANIRFLYEAIIYYPDRFTSFKNIGAKSIDEICKTIENNILEHYDQISAYINGENIVPETSCVIDYREETDPFKLTIPQLINHPIYKGKAKKYLIENNIPIGQMGLSVRSVNALSRANILSFYDALSVYPDNLSSLKNIGAKSIDEIKARMEYYISKMQNAVPAYCSGDLEVMYSDEYIYETVLSCFENIGFNGISFKEIRIAFPDKFDETRIKKCIGGLLADKQLEYVDFKLYRVYPSIYTVISKSSLDFENKDILFKKLNGMTLQSIAEEYGVTRERIRQKFEKNLKKMRYEELLNKYGVTSFDEDYYTYLYSHYEVIKEMWLDFLGVPIKTFYYLVNSQTKGKEIINNALSDPKVNLILKFKIQDYLNRNKVLINGKLIEKQRSDIEDYALSQIARDEISYDEFAELYNELLQQNDIEFDDKIYYTDAVRRTRSNRMSESMFCLWKQGEKIRYYDIAGQDYDELLDVLNLESFVNTEISTLKFFNDYPSVMEKYDIRDQYELHNLLKKIVDCNKYNDISFHRQPIIKFGTFDRTQAIYDLMVAFSPITSEKLAEYVSSEYGYDKATAQSTYFQPLNQYFHQGVYSVEFKRIPYDRIEVLKAELPDEFYYISEIKAIYKKLFGNADVEEINPWSLKTLGYNVFTSYVLKTYSRADTYFRDVLNSKDVFSLKELNERYGNLRVYMTTLYDMRRNYDILLFEDGQYINFRRIEKLSITKDDIKKFCDDIYNQIDENQYFTIHTLQELEINTKLESLGFGEVFFAGILAMSTKFLYTQIFGKLVFYKGQNVSGISKKSFILSLFSDYDDVDIEQFKDDCFDMYGIRIPDRYEITNAIADTNYYYDEIMGKVYKNKSFYYSEFDD